uniref:GAF domain-containing protein n=1 Tax=Oscillatoria sp. FACHB-1407 TaxID=2692847 RepID=UPI0016847777
MATQPPDRVSVSAIEYRLLEATAQAVNALLTRCSADTARVAPLDQAVNTALQILGESLDTDRVNIHETVASPPDSAFPGWRALEYEWNSSRTVPQYADQKAAQGSFEEIPEIFERLHQGQIMSYLIEEMLEPFRSTQMAIGIKSTHLVPIFVEGQWWGVLGMDDCREAKQRSEGELAILRVAADCIGSAIERDRTQQALLQAEQERTRNAAKHSQELEQLNAELRQTLEHLTESEHRYRTLFELSSEGIYRWQLDQPISIALTVDEQVERIRHSLYVAEANAAYAAMYGLPTTDAASGLRLSDAHILTSGKNFEFLRWCIENGYCIRAAESEEITPKGKRCYFLNNVIGIVEDGHLIGGWGTQLDISELRETQQALLEAEQKRSQELERINAELQQTLNRLTESEQRYRQLMELASEGIFRVEYEQPIPIDLPVEEQVKRIYQQYHVVEHNLAFAQMYGHDQPDAMIGARLTDWHVTDAPENAIQMEQFVRNGHQMRNQETVEFDRFGQKRYFLNNGFSIIRDGYAVSGWGTQIDITELRETQQALLEAEQARVAELAKVNEELQQRDRLLEATATAANILSTVTNFDEAVNTALQILGEAIDTDRIAVLENFDVPSERLPHWRVLYEWDAAHTPSQLSHPDATQGSYENSEEWYKQFIQGQGVSYLLGEIPEKLRVDLEKVGVKATNAVPIFVEDQFWGVLGFDDCREAKQRSSAELSVLKIAADCIGSAIQQQRTQQALLRTEQARVAELAKANEELQQRDRLLSVVAQVTKDLLEAEDIDVAIPAALQAVGEVANMSRVLLHIERLAPTTPRLSHCVAYEWTAEGINTHRSVGLDVMDNEDYQVLIQPMYNGQSVWRVIDDLPDVTGRQFKKLDIQSTGVIPVFIEGRYIGCVAFDDCITPRQWSQQEIDVLTTAAESIGAALHRKQLVDRLIEERIHAEQERAAELAKANNTLKQTVDVLATETDLNRFLGHVLQVIANQLDAPL